MINEIASGYLVQFSFSIEILFAEGKNKDSIFISNHHLAK
jgi:hypothetical protein